ncbi:MAG: hypothetical protein QM756_19940 [Polyangiaceae bacterium]
MTSNTPKLRRTATFGACALLSALGWPGCSSDKYSDSDAADCMGGAVAAGGLTSVGGSKAAGGAANQAGDSGLGGLLGSGGGEIDSGGVGGDAGAAGVNGARGGAKSSGGSAGTAGRANTGGGGAAGGSSAGGTAGSAGTAGTAGKAAVCGNGTKEAGEDCDDGNLIEGDGCNVVCKDSHACDACVATNCTGLPATTVSALRQKCFSDTTPAAAGPAQGTPRNQLCTRVVQCIRKNRAAAAWQTTDCTPEDAGYCGLAAGPSCDASPSGPCVKEYEAAAEPTNSSGISGWTQGALTSTTLPLGVASNLLTRCEASLCPEECGWLYDCYGAPCNGTRPSGGASGSGGANCAGGSANGGAASGGKANGGAANGGANNGGSGSGGAPSGGALNGGAPSGGSGSGGAPSGGAASGGAASGGSASGGAGGQSSCATQYDCTKLSGVASSGTTLSTLCQNAVTCMTAAKCATKSSAAPCYCSVLLGSCSTVNGACVAELDAAAESSAPSQTLTRLSDPGYAAGLAAQRAMCEAAP